jgi:hypothetical protein
MKITLISFIKDESVIFKINTSDQTSAEVELPIDDYDLTNRAIKHLETYHTDSSNEAKAIAKTLKEMMLDSERASNTPKKYAVYFKDVSHLDEVDVYQVNHIFNIQDPSGCIQHANKKLLLSGVRTGGKSKFKDIEEARDTLNRWLEINK